MHRPGVEPAIFRSQVRRPNHFTTEVSHACFGGRSVVGPKFTVTIWNDTWSEKYLATAIFYLRLPDSMWLMAVCCRHMCHIVTASWHVSCRRVLVAMHARRWWYAARPHHTMNLRLSRRCYLVKGMFLFKYLLCIELLLCWNYALVCRFGLY